MRLISCGAGASGQLGIGTLSTTSSPHYTLAPGVSEVRSRCRDGVVDTLDG